MLTNEQRAEALCHPEHDYVAAESARHPGQGYVDARPLCHPEQATEASAPKDLDTAEGTLPVAERFVSINGEGTHAGYLAAFIRFTGCNLACSYCDTSWANAGECSYEDLNVAQLVEWVVETGVACVTLTGGEPVLQPGLSAIIEALVTSDAWGGSGRRVVEIETNGAVDLAELDALRRWLVVHEGMQAAEPIAPSTRTRICFTMDCKMPSSGMAARMVDSNYDLLGADDAVKFVVGSRGDLEEAARVIDERSLCERCTVFFSPVFSCIDPAQIVAFMEERRLSQVRLQLQLHKIIWPDVDKGV